MNLPLGINFQQIFLHILNLALLTMGLYFLLYNPVKKFFIKREEYYKKIDDDANKKLESAESLERKASARLSGIDDEIAKKRKKSDLEIEEYLKKQIDEANEKAEKIISTAKMKAENERNEILHNADKDIINMTKEATAKIIYNSQDEAFASFLDAVERKAENDE